VLYQAEPLPERFEQLRQVSSGNIWSLNPWYVGKPTLLFCRFAAMAVGTPDHTLPNFLFDYTPRNTPIDHCRNLSCFGAGDVVKVQNTRVAFSTVNAWMFALVIPKKEPGFRNHSKFPRVIHARIAAVVRSRDGPIALFAVILQTVFLSFVFVELNLLFLHSATRTEFQEFES
jgi:hypothetical protein